MSSKDKKTREKQEREGREGFWDATERFSSNLAPLAFSQKGDITITKHRRWAILFPTAGAKYKMRSSPRWGCCTCPGWAAVVQAPWRPAKYTLLTGQTQWDGVTGTAQGRERQCCLRGSKDLLKASRSRQRAWEHTTVSEGHREIHLWL